MISNNRHHETLSQNQSPLIPIQVLLATAPTPTQAQHHPHPPQDDTSLQAAQVAWRTLFSRHASSTAPTPADSRRPITLTLENQSQNVPWGDPLGPKPDNVTRIYSLNTNGLSLDRRGGRFNDLCVVAKEVQADVICCQEHNLDTTQSPVRHILYETMRQHWSRSRLQFGTTSIPFTTQYKPGGTMMAVVNHLSGRVDSHSKDDMGRWVSYTLRGRNSQHLTVISVYQVVTDSPRQGVSTAAAQQQSLLLQSADTISSPRKAFKRDLRQFVQSRQAKGDEILIVGDYNEAFGSDENDGITRLATDLNLSPLMMLRHEQPPPATYSRGRTCLDYGLATAKFSDSLVRCGYVSTQTTEHIISISTQRPYSEIQRNCWPIQLVVFSNPTMSNKSRNTFDSSMSFLRAATRFSEPRD